MLGARIIIWNSTETVTNNGRLGDSPHRCQPKNNGNPPKIIHLFIGFSIILTHFNRVWNHYKPSILAFSHYFWKHPYHDATWPNVCCFCCRCRRLPSARTLGCHDGTVGLEGMMKPMGFHHVFTMKLLRFFCLKVVLLKNKWLFFDTLIHAFFFVLHFQLLRSLQPKMMRGWTKASGTMPPRSGERE